MQKNQFYINKNIHYLINKNIEEWDIKRAGLHALKYMNIISKDTFNYWIKRNKDDISKYIGANLSKYMVKQNDTITAIVDKFIKDNNINYDKIISRKRDAIFLFNTNIDIKDIDIFHFVNKNKYTSYYKFDTFELYYNNKNNSLEIKGIDIRYIKNHALIPYIKEIIKYYELLDNGFVKYDEVYKYIHFIRNEYCNLLLPIDCYREINYENKFRLININTNEAYDMSYIPKDIKNYRLTINYNFMKFIVPFINILPNYKSFEKDNKTRWKNKR